MPDGNGVLCSGSIVLDILVRPAEALRWGTTTFVDAIEFHAGGNGANTSIALATLGVKTRLIGVMGTEPHAQCVLDRLVSAGVDTSSIGKTSSAPTATTAVMINQAGERAFLHRLGASEDAFMEPIVFNEAVIEGVSHYHFASLFVLPHMRLNARETLQRARAAGLSTSFDTNWDAEGRWMLDLQPCLEFIDTLFMNEDEARMITGYSDPGKAAEMIKSYGVATVVIKLGARGCVILAPNEWHECPGFAVEVKDTTGAGDCFVAGFLAARLQGKSLPEAGRFANAVAALSIQNVGSGIGVVSSAAVEQKMDLNCL